MKKFAKKIAAISLILVLLAACAACDLVTTNLDRDAAQVVATVSINDDVAPEKIYKREMYAGFLSYGYQYVQQYGYTLSQAYQTVLDNLVSNKVIVQYAKAELSKSIEGASVNATTAEELEKFLSEYEIAEAKYNFESNIDSLIDSYVDEEDEDEPEEDETFTERTAPAADDRDFDEDEKKTEAPTDDEYDLANVTLKKNIDELKSEYTTLYDLDMAVFGAYEADTVDPERAKALNKLLNFLKNNGLIGQDEEHADVREYTYFKDMRVSLLQSQIVSNYEDLLKTQSEAKLTDEGLWDEYEREYESQLAQYKNDVSAYETALDSLSEDTYVLANPFSGYGFVLNLLIPFSDEQTAELSKFKSEKGVSKDEITAKREEFAKEILASDQRASWVNASRGTYNKGDNSFTFKPEYTVSNVEGLKKFIGDVVVRDPDGKLVEDDNGVEKTQWSFENVKATKIPFETFFADYVTANVGLELKYFEEGNDATLGFVEYTDDLGDAFKDLMFAFSTDTGCLGLDYGYMYSPYNNSFVDEFAAASEAVIAKGAGYYTTVLTDYGYHIIICTKAVDVAPVYTLDDAGKTKFLADLKNDGTLAYKYREDKLDSMLSNEINRVSEEKIYKALHPEDGERKAVKYFAGTYSDLISE